MLASYYMPLQRHGLYRVSVSGTSNSAPQRAIVSHRRTLPVVQPWSYYQTVVMPPADSVRRQISYYAEGNSLGYLMLPYTGQGHYQIGAVRQDYYPQHLPLVRSELGRYPFEGSGEGWLLARAHLEPGRYVVRYRLAGGAAETLVERKPVPVRLGVLVAGERDIGLEEVRDWYEHDRSVSTTIADPTPVAPQSGALVAPWWTSIPWVGDSAYELVFRLPQARAVLFLYAYEGDADLRLRDAGVYRQTLQEMP
jgi:hypothetical protein